MSTVSIVLSNYNHAKYLPDSLGHICNQTWPADQILVIDDGSTDNSVEIIEDFGSRTPWLTLIRNERNLGLQESIKRALGHVTSDFLVWAASDDRLLPNFLERNMDVLSRHRDAVLCFSETSVLMDNTGAIERFAANPTVDHIFDLSDLPEFLDPAAVRRRMKRAYLPIATNTGVVRTQALRDFGGYAAELRWHSDWFTYYALAMRFGTCVVPETLALVRAVPGSYSGGMNDPVRQTEVLKALLAILGRPENRDLRACFRDCPSNLSNFGVLMLNLLAKRPGDWDLFFPYFVWKLKEYKRGHRLTWGEVGRQMVRRGLAGVAANLAALAESRRGHSPQ